LRFPDIY
jgi:hypothetical protein